MDHEKRQAKARPSRSKSHSKHGSGGARSVLFALFTLLLVGVCTAGMFAGIFMKYVKTNIIPVVQVRAEDYTMNQSSFIYYQDRESGEWVDFQTIHGAENRVLVDIEDGMADSLWQAAVAIEDHRFFDHKGVDWRRTGGAVLNMFIGMKNTFGGSTITQQMLKNMTEDNDPYVNRKVREIFRALEFEKNNTKDQILELYLNTIYLGKGCYGVQTAAQYYFGKDASELSVAESACLIAITNNPAMYGPMYDIEITVKNEDGTTSVKTPRELNKKRQEQILYNMYDPKLGLEYLTREEYEAAKAEVLNFTDGTTSADDIVTKTTGGVKVNSWFVDEVFRDVTKDLAEALQISVKEAEVKVYNGGYHIYTTLDPEIQEIAESVYEDRSNLDLTSRDGQPIRSGITIMDPYTGNVVAMVGDLGVKQGNLLTNYARDRRQVGSSIKPLTAYAPAIDSGAVTPGTAFDDYPVELMNESYWPKNSPPRYRGFTQVEAGLQHSINTIAVQTLQKGGVADAFAFATEKLCLSLDAEDMDRSPLGMGGLHRGLNTEEMAAAYSCFVNNGVYNEPRTYVKVEDSEGNVVLENEAETHVAMKETTAYLMNKMLKKAVAAGTGTQAKFSGMTIAGKTGTTDDNYTRYFVGYTPYYVASVWTGYKYNAGISYKGGNPAITLWKKVMQPIHENLENKDFTKPSTGLTTVTLCADSGLLATEACKADSRGSRVVSVEIASGTAPTESCGLHVMRDYCTAGHCLATENCPAETIIQKAFLDHERQNYGPNVVAEDDAYLVSSMEKAIGLRPTYAEDGTEIAPPSIGCPAHGAGGAGITDPDDSGNDPSDPNYNPPVENPDEGSNGGTTDPSVPVEPTEPTTPAEPDGTTPTDPGGTGGPEDEWWQDLWQTTE